MFGVRLPELPYTEILHEHWQDLGYATALPQGFAPLTWAEIAAYDRLTGAGLNNVEAQCLMDMSRAYARLRADTSPLSIQPMERVNG